MKNPITLLFFIVFLTAHGSLFSQRDNPPQTEQPPRVVDFTFTPEVDGYRFTPIFPPLQQKAGAPAAYWTCYWEFGDGSFSFEDKPLHAFAKTGAYEPVLYATAHYDDGKPPNGRAKGLVADRSAKGNVLVPDVFEETGLAIKAKAIRDPRAEEELACIISYRNLGAIATDGRLHLFFNEKRFPDPHFRFDSIRSHFAEYADASYSLLPSYPSPTMSWASIQTSSSAGANTSFSADFPPPNIAEDMLRNARGAYREENAWRFSNLQPGEKRNFFVTIAGTPKMLKDTSAFIHLEAIFAPFDPLVPPERYVLEIEIVASHDPNAIAVSDNRVNYRIIGSKNLAYKVQFQNNGEGPASTVELSVETPEGLDMKRMRPMEWYPKCPICPKPLTNRGCLDTLSSKNGLVFTFRNIYLPGSRQKGVEDRDSTKGFVKYRIEADKNMPKLPFRSRAKIVFDKNPPIYTNFTKTNFKIGTSPGLKIGYDFAPDSFKNGYVFFGASLSPYKSWRIYPQIELLTGIKGQTEFGELRFNDTLPLEYGKYALLGSMDSIQYLKRYAVIDSTVNGKRGFITVEVPVLLRKNFTGFFGAGIGGSVRLLFENGEDKANVTGSLYTVDVNLDPPPPVVPPVFTTTLVDSLSRTTVTSHKATRTRFSVFGDLTFGAVRAGPNLGIRAGAILENRRKPRPFVQVSLEFKL